MILRSPLLEGAGFRHGFSTRRGGHSVGAFEALNLAFGLGDDEAAVIKNRARFFEAIGVAEDRAYEANQVHGTHTIRAEGDPALIRALDADALVAFAPSVGVFVRTADCVPLLLADPSSGAALAVHAGWRGAVAEIVGRSLRLFLNATGARPETLLAAIGPHIGKDAFEVGPEVIAAFDRASPPDAPKLYRANGDRYLADLGGLVLAQLLHAGLIARHIDALDRCTFTDSASFFSYRRDGALSGRQLSGIVARAPR